MSARTMAACFLAILGAARGAHSQTFTVAGELSVEPPTLLSLGRDGKIAGDDNRTAQVGMA